jgi:hypothetical protein
MPTMRETIQKVSGFADLPQGWHFGEGVPPSQGRIGQAIGFLEYASFIDIERANAFPGVRGQVEVTFYSGNRMLEITIESDDSITIAEDHDREQVSFEENLSKSDAYRRLEEFSQNIWASSDHYILSITTPSVSAASLVAHWTSGAGSRFQSWTKTVPRRSAVQYVRILKGTTTSKPVTHESTGVFRLMTYRPRAISYLREPQLGMTVTGTSTVGDAIRRARHSND